jgi:hypothetical protein
VIEVERDGGVRRGNRSGELGKVECIAVIDVSDGGKIPTSTA